MDFTGKVAIVTGGANGIGKEIVRGIVNGGGFVVIADINEAAANKTVEEFGPEHTSFKYMDLGNHESIVKSMNEILAERKVDILVNCAGVISAKPFDQLTYEEWENKGGRIVNVSSVAAKLGGGLLGTAAYASSKAGLNGLTKAVAKEGGKYNIACNAVCPSFTRTDMTTVLSEDKEKSQKVISMIPLGRRAEPTEIAQMILFFASDLASFVTGEIGDCDGGITLDG